MKGMKRRTVSQSVESLARNAKRVQHPENLDRIAEKLRGLKVSLGADNEQLKKEIVKHGIENVWYLTNANLEYIRKKMSGGKADLSHRRCIVTDWAKRQKIWDATADKAIAELGEHLKTTDFSKKTRLNYYKIVSLVKKTRAFSEAREIVGSEHPYVVALNVTDHIFRKIKGKTL
jgi:hypothetical protein